MPVRRSQGHIATLEVLRKIFPGAQIKEDYPIHPERGKTLYIDLYVPAFAIAFEIDGEQHDTYNSYLHKSRRNFSKQRANDFAKDEWCETSNVKLCRIKHDMIISEELILNLIKEKENDS